MPTARRMHRWSGLGSAKHKPLRAILLFVAMIQMVYHGAPRSRPTHRGTMIRLGVIGYGRRMRSVLAAIDRFKTGARVVAVVDPRVEELRRAFPEALSDATTFDSADHLLDDAQLDGVLIGMRCSLLARYAIKVLQRHLPLFLEKPV